MIKEVSKSVSAKLAKAIDAQKIGSLEDAEKLYKQILALAPEQPEANHNLGILVAQNGRFAEAKPFFEIALKQDPSRENYWVSIIRLHLRLGENNTAVNLLKEAIGQGVTGPLLDELNDQINTESEQYREDTGSALHGTEREKLLGLFDQGKYTELIPNLQDVIASKPDDEFALSMLGVANIETSNFQSAIEHIEAALKIYPNSIQNWLNLGITLQKQDKFYEATEKFEKVAEIDPNDFRSYFYLGLLSQKIGNDEKALKSYSKAINLNPSHSDSYNNKGNILYEKKMWEEAKESYLKAIQLNPKSAHALNNLGNIEKSLGNVDKALEHFIAATELGPKNPETFFNVAVIFLRKKDPLNAEGYNNRALKIDSDFVPSLALKGRILSEMGNFDAAVSTFKTVIERHPEFSQTFIYVGQLFKDSIVSFYSKDSELLMAKLFENGTAIRPAYVRSNIVRLLMLDPNLIKIRQDFSNDKNDLYLPAHLRGLGEKRLMNVAMRITPLTSLTIEEFLLSVRKSCLFAAEKIEILSSDLRFLISLALQADLTEYIYPQTEEEEALVAKLEKKISSILNSKQQPTDQDVLILACYTALNKVESIKLLVPTRLTKEVLKRQISHTEEEIALRAIIPSLGAVNDETSNLVKQQYEENPFPRWLQDGSSVSITSFLELYLEGTGLKIDQLETVPKNPKELLIAGCGTGRQAINRAKILNECSILAVDISLNSLCYALRKTQEYKIKNIEYLQADILDLHHINKRFDVIECGGVLHHMSDPKKGLASLTRLLKPNGYMLLGLYSKHARGQKGYNIVDIIDLAKTLGVTEDLRSIRAFRQKLIRLNEDNKDAWGIGNFQDFYSTSEFRDLFLHRHEIRMGIPEIKELLDLSGLKFRGFTSLKKEVLVRFRNENSGEDDLLNLEKWNEFELRNPKTFIGMYQFWCEKTVI